MAPHAKTICQHNGCSHPAKSVATNGDGDEKWVCGIHARSLEGQGWKISSPERYQDGGRGVSAWIMVPMHVVVDTSGVGRIVEATPEWDHARLAQDDFGDPLDFEICEPMPDRPFWQGVDELDANGKGTMRMLQPTQAERKRFEEILWDDLEEWFETEATPTGSGTWVPE